MDDMGNDMLQYSYVEVEVFKMCRKKWLETVLSKKHTPKLDGLVVFYHP